MRTRRQTTDGRRQTRSPIHRAFTLLELLLVLGLIVVLLGLAMPGIGRLYVRNQLKNAAQEFQSVLYQTRLQAMKTGKAQVFRYRYGSPVFEIIPKEVFDQRKKGQEGVGAVSTGPELLNAPPTPETETASGLYERTLPQSIVFGNKQETPDTPELMMSSESPTNSDTELERWTEDINGENALDDGWSQPTVFFPNGRTSQTALELRTTGRYNFRQQVILRGLTGTAMLR